MGDLGAVAVGIIAVVCAAALGGLAVGVAWARRHGARHQRLCALALAVSLVALVVALLALALGAYQIDTGRFLIGMSVGVAVGLPLGCAIILTMDRRAAQRAA